MSILLRRHIFYPLKPAGFSGEPLFRLERLEAIYCRLCVSPSTIIFVSLPNFL